MAGSGSSKGARRHIVEAVRPTRVLVSGFAALLALASPAGATLVNGDFEQGFNGWQGIVDFPFAETMNPDLDFPANFDASSGAAQLTTTFMDNGIFFVGLFQTFVLDPVAPGASLFLTYDLVVGLSDPAFDLALAQIALPDFSIVISLLNQSHVDITPLAGQGVELLFGISDGDGPGDVLTVDNVRISPTATPEPGTVVLFALASAVLLLARRRMGPGKKGSW